MPAAHAAVLVVDDDRGVRMFVRTLLERAGFGVLEAADADEALDAVARQSVSLVLLDVKLPRVSGYELLRQLRDRLGESLPIIFISGERTDSYDRVAGLMLGADDYLLKPLEPDDLLARVRRSLRPRGNGAPDGSLPAQLTPRELEILGLVAGGWSTAQIAHKLVISPRTVTTHVHHVMAKLGVNSRAQAAAIAHRAGLVGVDPGPPAS